MKPQNVALQVSSMHMDCLAAAMLIMARYPAEVMSSTDEFISLRIDLRYLESLHRWCPREIMLETMFREGDIVLHFPSDACQRGYWARVHATEQGIDWQMLVLRSQERFPGSNWVNGSPEWAEARVSSISCVLKRRPR